jgi:acetate kinase
MTILTVNTGSSSIRLDRFVAVGAAVRHLDGHHGEPADGDEQNALDGLLRRSCAAELQVIAHRVVHGGGLAPGPHRIDGALEAQIETLSPLAPLHNPAALAWIRSCRARWPQLPQYALFDTAFFHDLPAVARRYALPGELVASHDLRRYGFHGLAHEAMWRHLRAAHPGASARVISLQLGSGCSIAAIRDGRPIDTSMGYSPLEGLVMATRAGDLDPGLLLHLLRSGATTLDELDTLLSRRSGLLGVSGRSGDMRELLAADDDDARLAVALYCYRARKYLGAYLAALGGADAILFGGGVGEHSAPIRAAIVDGMQWAGIRLDPDANQRANGGHARLHADDSAIAIHAVAVDEARILAEQALSALTPSAQES